jgi:hypothetical protein
VLSFNVFEGRADVDALAALIGQGQDKPDLVSLPEAGEAFRLQLAPMLGPLGYRLTSSTQADEPDGAGVTMGISPALGDVHTRSGTPTSTFPYLEQHSTRLRPRPPTSPRGAATSKCSRPGAPGRTPL